MSRRDGLFRKDGSPYWYFWLPLGNGKYRQTSTKKTNYQEAVRRRNEVLQQAHEGTLPTDLAKKTLVVAIEEHIALRKGMNKPTRTWKAEQSRLRAVERVLGGNLRLENLRPEALDHYHVTRTGAGIKPETINGEVKALRYILKRARLWSRFQGVYKPMTVRRDSPRRPPTVEQFNSLITLAQGNKRWDAAFYGSLIADQTTARGYEILSLRLGDIYLNGDFDCAAPHLKVYRDGTKSDRGVRVLPLNSVAEWAVRKLLERAKAKGATAPEHYLFPHCLGRHTKSEDPLHGKRGYDPTQPQKDWKKAWASLRQKAGLPGIHFHDLRHAAITNGRKHGTQVDDMQRLAGHISAQMTDYYTHLGNDTSVAAVRCIERANPQLLDILGITNPRA